MLRAAIDRWLLAAKAEQGCCTRDPNSPLRRFAVGSMLVNRDNLEAGIPHLLKARAVRDEAGRISCLHAVGIAYASLGDLETALHYLRRAREAADSGRDAKLVDAIDEDLWLPEDAAK